MGLPIKMHKSKDEARKAAVAMTASALIEKALARGVSDVHIEPRERVAVVRSRVDGWLQETAKLPITALDELLSELKQRAELDADNSTTPQSGSFQFASKSYDATVQIATMPTVMGEKAVLHLTAAAGEPATLESLGFWGEGLARIESSILEPHGLILAASVNRTGTSLSLLGIAHLLNNPALNIATLEDSIEHRLPGITQTQVNAANGVSFPAGLQALLKQDPNVVMVSDIHEQATAELALQASLNGRLLLGGLHVSDAAHGLTHLLQMHTEPFLVASALRVALGQRFVRRLCVHCREPFTPDTSLRTAVKRLVKSSNVQTVRQLHELEKAAAEAGLGTETDKGPLLSTTEKNITRLWRASAEGCPHCNFRGYQGRLGVCEVVANSDAMKKLLASGKSTTESIQKLAAKEGTVPLALDGLIKALRGLTTIDEVLPLAP